MLQRVIAQAICASFIIACGPKPTGVEFTAKELESERPKEAYNRVKPPQVLKRTAPKAVPKPSVTPIPEDGSCTSYCAHIMRHCVSADAMYASTMDCLSTCRAAEWTAGDTGATNTDSLSCRITWAKAAAQDVRRCVDAGPTSPACRQVSAEQVLKVSTLNSAGLCILGLYDSTDQPAWNAGAHCRDVILKQRVSPIVSEMGFSLRLHDISKGLPSNEDLTDCRAVISAFYDGKMVRAEQYARWLSQHAKSGRRIIILNNFGAYQDPSNGRWVSHDVINAALRMIGIRYDGQWTGDARVLSVGAKNPEMFRVLPDIKQAAHYYRFKTTRDDVLVHFEVEREDLNDGASAVVMTSPAGGMALTRYYETQSGTELLNLAAFLKAALLTPVD